jgi:serine protease Do
MISSMQPDANATLKVWRDGSARTLSVTLGELNPQEARNRGNGRNDDGSADALDGVSVENLTPQIARELKLPAGAAGVVVNEVSPASAAARAGLKQGDVIQEVDRRPVRNVAEFEAAVRNSKEGTLLLVNRDGHTTYIGV